jgi:16S rRNA (cytosine1402-N4)-methyltransferase
LLAPALEQDGAVLIDATLGLGGHAQAALERFPNITLIGLDRDPKALEKAAQRLAPWADRIHFVHAVYDEIEQVLESLNIDEVHGVLFDLGVSSMQLDEDDRGFAYSRNAPLDMRMDNTSSLTAAHILNTYDVRDLTRILRVYGEERFAPRVAAAIVRERAIEPFTDSERLVNIVRDAIPAATRRTGGNPAKRTFQALRIEVNDELAVLERAIPAALDALAVNGRIVVLSYHSLEDRIVKNALRVGTETTAPLDLPVIPESAKPWLSLLSRGSEPASEAEIAENPRAASVRLRAAVKVRNAA